MSHAAYLWAESLKNFVNHEPWMAEGACLTLDLDMFFPPGTDATGGVKYREGVAKAKAICAVCPVQRQCLEFAMANEEEFGIWGGTTAGERAGRRSGLALSETRALEAS